ncbi:multidrug effflux MFS transporter [Brachybacterium sp. EF45031]|nr:multidrug effflux MFS transporter [Brachybacterium sillae]
MHLPTLTGPLPVVEDHVEQRVRVTALMIAVLTTISAIGPLATDMYIPAFPQVAQDFAATPARIQLTLTAFFLGAAGGQVVAGPLSDRLGRRVPLLIGLVLTLAGSVGCALAGSADMMLLMRVLQGVGGGFGMVLARAVLIDLAHGPELFRILNIMQGIGGVAPIIAPLLGGLILAIAPWHTVFWVIAGMTLISTLGVLLVIPESLPVDRRHTGGFRQFLRNVGALLRRRRFTAYLLVNAFSAFALMSYVSASTFVVQDMLGYGPTIYALMFALNSTGMMSMAFLSARLVRTHHPRQLIRVGLGMVALAGGALLTASLLGTPPAWVVLPAFFVLVTAQGLIFGNGGALAAQQAVDMAGTGSALLGLGFSFAASSAAPLVGLAGSASTLPMSLTIVAGVALSTLMFVLAGREDRPGRGAPTADGAPA